MNITLTGSLGHIGKPLTNLLVGQGHAVAVVSSSPERSDDITALGATPAIGGLRDTDFLITAFTGADLVYVMVPPANYFDHALDLTEYYRSISESFTEAIRSTDVKRVINLSSIGAHMKSGNGILSNTYWVEQRLNELPADVAITHVRPTSFYYNLFGFTEVIRHQGVIAANMGPEVVNVHVAPEDIAVRIAEEIKQTSGGRKVIYVGSEELRGREAASILGEAIGKPDLKWVGISDEEYAQSLTDVGMQPTIARGLAEMYGAIRTGALYEHYFAYPPAMLGETKMKDFAKSFAAVYHQST